MGRTIESIKSELDANNVKRVALDNQITEERRQLEALNRENEKLERELQEAVSAEAANAKG